MVWGPWDNIEWSVYLYMELWEEGQQHTNDLTKEAVLCCWRLFIFPGIYQIPEHAEQC